MVGPLLYEMSIPLFRTALQNQIFILKKGQSWCKDNGHDTAELVSASISGDMFGLPFHVTFCANNVCQALLDLEVLAPFEVPDIITTEETNMDRLIQILEQTVSHLDQVSSEAFGSKEKKVVKFEAGPMSQELSALQHLQDNILPSFWFHNTMVYCILKSKGVALNKMMYVWGLEKPSQK